MKTIKDLAKKHFDAFHKRDEATIREILHPEYTFKGPGLVLNSPEESIEFMLNMPGEFTGQNFRYFVDGDTVTHAFEAVFTKPIATTISMCELIKIKDNKVIRIELFYDSAAMSPS